MQINWRTWAARIGIALVLLGGVLTILSRFWLEPKINDRLRRAVSEHFQADVELANVDVHVFPRVGISGDGLALRPAGHPGTPPLISAKHFKVSGGLFGALASPPHVSRVELEGLEIRIPPGGMHLGGQEKKPSGSAPKFVVDRVTARNTLLLILPKDSGKAPRRYEIQSVDLRSVGVDRPMHYQAALTNPKPLGAIDSEGEFGPWDADEPGATPLSGNYVMHAADLGVFKGIAGHLTSKGNFRGQLARIEIDGETDAPDFTVQVSGNPVHLKTTFHALVDGTDGTTKLDPVDARLLQSRIVARGGVYPDPGKQGRRIILDVTVPNARIEDLLRLAVKNGPPLTGDVTSLRFKMEIPPGDVSVAQKLKLDGEFGIGSGKFTSATIQSKVTGLSNRAEGNPEQGDQGSVASQLNGRFTMDGGIIRFAPVEFSVPGAFVQLTGTYALESQEIDFDGTARIDAKPSEAVTGWKSWLLKGVDPFVYKKGKGTTIPIHVGGDRKKPSFGLRMGGNKSK